MFLLYCLTNHLMPSGVGLPYLDGGSLIQRVGRQSIVFHGLLRSKGDFQFERILSCVGGSEVKYNTNNIIITFFILFTFTTLVATAYYILLRYCQKDNIVRHTWIVYLVR